MKCAFTFTWRAGIFREFGTLQNVGLPRIIQKKSLCRLLAALLLSFRTWMTCKDPFTNGLSVALPVEKTLEESSAYDSFDEMRLPLRLSCYL